MSPGNGAVNNFPESISSLAERARFDPIVPGAIHQVVNLRRVHLPLLLQLIQLVLRIAWQVVIERLGFAHIPAFDEFLELCNLGIQLFDASLERDQLPAVPPRVFLIRS